MKTTTARPLKITIDGELAEEIREASRSTGISPSVMIRSHLRGGLLMSAPTTKGHDYRLASAAEMLGVSMEVATAMHREASRRKATGVKVAVEVSADVLSRARARAKETGETLSQLVSRALQEFSGAA
jgi:post-segregation antitoxin (ccd killing protein)